MFYTIVVVILFIPYLAMWGYLFRYNGAVFEYGGWITGIEFFVVYFTPAILREISSIRESLKFRFEEANSSTKHRLNDFKKSRERNKKAIAATSKGRNTNILKSCLANYVRSKSNVRQYSLLYNEYYKLNYALGLSKHTVSLGLFSVQHDIAKKSVDELDAKIKELASNLPHKKYNENILDYLR